MAEVRYASGVPTAAAFAGLGAPTQCAPIVVDSTTGIAYTLKTGDVVVPLALAGVSASVTTGSLVGKTMTFVNGVLTGFA